MTTNIGKSVRTRLLNYAKNEHLDYMKVLVRYLHERFLYRISISKYKQNFLLKGGSLLYAYDMFRMRPTIDIDLLGERISRDPDYLRVAFECIADMRCEEDGVTFDPETIKISSISIDKKYPGISMTITANLDTIIQPISIDIGFGDIVTPKPLTLDYPLLLDDIPHVELYANSLETLIAEKFHSMVDRDESNSRMKDFFDVYYLFKNHQIDIDTLKESVVNTFSNRGTKYHDGLMLFTDEFCHDKARTAMWKNFLRKINWKDDVPFDAVMSFLKEKLECYWELDELK